MQLPCKQGCGHSRSFSTVWHEILRVLIFCDFCVFSAIHKNKLPQLKITTKHFPAKIYSGVNILRLKFTTQKYSTKKSCLFNYNLSLSFRKKSGIQWNTDADRSIGPVLFENMHFYCTYSIKTKILSMLGTGYFLKIAKINSQQINKSVLIAKISSRKTQKIAYPQK